MTGFFFDIGGLDSENDMFFFRTENRKPTFGPYIRVNPRDLILFFFPIYPVIGQYEHPK